VSPHGRRDRDRGVVVITGASSGIGRAAAHRFARRGASLVLAARGVDALEDVVRECVALGARAVAVPTDVSEPSQVAALAEAAIARFGRIDVWVGNASVFAYGAFEDTPPEVFRQQLETNFFGQIEGVRAVLPVFHRQGGGTLIFVASIYGRVTSPYASGYVASKHALMGFSEVLRQELRGSGIDVCTVLPATIDTPIYQNSANYTGHPVHPLPPIVSPKRVASAIVRLARRPRRAAVVGRLQGLLVPMHEFTPGLYHATVRPAMDLLALRRGEAAPSAGNVFEPQQQNSAVTGGWRLPAPVRLLPFAAVLGAALVAVRRLRRL